MKEQLSRTIWPVTPPQRSRDPKKPMRLLTLGLPRTGTDSLRTALSILGYGPIWHGFEMPMSRSNEPAFWVPLLQAKAQGNHQLARDFDWDVMLGDCEVLMDMPPVIFAEELLDYYPDAKVLLNRRKDLFAWHKSLWNAFKVVFGPFLWTTHWFDAEFYWWYQTLILCMRHMGNGEDFEKHGRQWAEEYYTRIERKLKQDGRVYLNWEVVDGWEGLCEFLGEKRPDFEFPWGNKGGEEFKRNSDKASEKMIKRALMKLGVVVGLLAVAIAFVVRLM